MKRLVSILLLTTLALTKASDLSCINGFTKKEVVIPVSKINDGYCDCIDGSDELLTDACSGSQNWAGTGDHRGVMGDESRYHCPQQNIYLPLSRLNDGICDCCDGSDEPIGVCSDNCDSVLAEERQRKQKLIDSFTVGKKKLDRETNAYRRLVKHVANELNELEAKKPALNDIVKLKSEELRTERDLIYQSHVNRVKGFQNKFRSSGEWEGAFSDTETMEEYIVASCQYYGESSLASTNNKYNKDKLCEPLRSAALDIGLVWDGSNVKIGTNDEIINIFLEREGLSKSSRDDEEWVDPEDAILDDLNHHHDDDVYGESMYDDDDGALDYYEDDEAEERKRQREDHRREKDRRKDEMRRERLNKREKEKVESNDKKVDIGKLSLLMRSSFLEKAENILALMDDLLKVDEEEDIDSDNDGNEKEPLPADFDPMAIQMNRNVLSGRIGQVQYGEELASSAGSMLKSMQENLKGDRYTSLLEMLVIGVTNLSKISEVDMEEILTVINTDVDENSCFSLYNAMCNEERNNDSVGQRCAERSGVNSCEDVNGESQIPSVIFDGYLKYYVPNHRGPDDRLTKIFDGYYGNIFENSSVRDLNTEVDNSKGEIEKLKKEVQKLESEMGLATNPPKFGKDGELYSIRDECFNISVGKYTYELCMFDRAYQREGSAKTGGTDLGKWKGYSESDDGSPVWKWEDGAKCWNGPKRSATVHITCGAETKLISADEPNICEYEFKMESYIGCDENFKTSHDL